MGAGIQRYKFQEDKRNRNTANIVSANQQVTTTLQAPSTRFASSSLLTAPGDATLHQYIHIPPGTTGTLPGNELTILTSAFVRTIKRSTDLRYNLWWSFGSFLEGVPRRLGTNDALDRAVDPLATSHTDFCMTRP